MLKLRAQIFVGWGSILSELLRTNGLWALPQLQTIIPVPMRSASDNGSIALVRG